MKNAIYFLILLFVVLPFSLLAQDFQWLRGGTYDPAIPTPRSVLGFEIGEYLTDHHPMVEYIHKLAEASDRVQIFKFGQSVERRDMYLLAISAPENISRLEEIRSTIKRLTDPRTVTAAEVERIAKETPPIGWMNYGTDGGETAAFEAAIQVAYQLAAGTDPLTQKILRNVVTIINPALNPDSHQAFVTWMKAATIGKKGTADPHASEHEGQWFISSDGNHYLIDTNRDAFALTQVETQAVAEVLHHWNPQVWVDNHGEPTEYTFAPFTSPMNLNYPASLRRWATEVGRNSARYFDQYGWTFVKDETYDLYYPGYWDSYPAFNGTISATYETNGGGWKGFSWERPDKTIVTLRDGIHGHFIADLATLEVLADNREAILRDFHLFFKTGMEEADQEEFKSYVLLAGKDSGRVDRLVELLLRHRIEVFRKTDAFASDTAQTYFDRTSKRREFPAGSYVIPMKQPKKRFAKTLLEPDPRMEESFMKEVEAVVARNKKLGRATRKEGHGFYDVTAWALPLTYGIETVFSGDAVAVTKNEQITERPVTPGGVTGGKAGYAYLFSSHSNGGMKLAGRLLQEDHNVAIATAPFQNSGNDYYPGTMIVRVERNPETLHERIATLSREYGVAVFAVNTAWGEVGISLGSRKIMNLRKPRILVMTNHPTQAVTFGSVYSVLEQRYELEFTAGRAESFSGFDLTRYNVILFPDGSASGYQDLLGETGIANLKHWIRNGGTFIGLKGGGEFATRKGVDLADVEVYTEVPDKTAEDKEAKKPVERLPGSIFRARINTDYYLGYGHAEEIAIQIRGNRLFSKTKLGTNVVTIPEKSFLMGHRWDDTEEALADSMYMADIPVGRGHVILFADDPTFRAYWVGLDRLVIGSILLATAF